MRMAVDITHIALDVRFPFHLGSDPCLLDRFKLIWRQMTMLKMIVSICTTTWQH